MGQLSRTRSSLHGVEMPRGSFAQAVPESSSGFSILAIDGTGVSSKVFTEIGLTNLGLRPRYDPGTNLVYSDGGRITNPADGTASGVLSTGVATFSGPTVTDSTLNRAYVLHQDSTTRLSYDLDIYDLTRQTFLKTITIPGVLGYPTQLVRWGTQGIAFSHGRCPTTVSACCTSCKVATSPG